MVGDPKCEHDDFETLYQDANTTVSWCPNCGDQWSTTQEQFDRVRRLFLQKLGEHYPGHPWVKSEQAKLN